MKGVVVPGTTDGARDAHPMTIATVVLRPAMIASVGTRRDTSPWPIAGKFALYSVAGGTELTGWAMTDGVIE